MSTNISLKHGFKGKKKIGCDNCPFRNEAVISLNPGRMTEIVEGLESGDAMFSCHKTTHGMAKHERHCVGALVFMKKRGTLLYNLGIRLAIWFGALDPDTLHGDDEICDTVEELEQYRAM